MSREEYDTFIEDHSKPLPTVLPGWFREITLDERRYLLYDILFPEFTAECLLEYYETRN